MSSNLLQELGQKNNAKLFPQACRKRRIKCGEERPTCTNCIKSKRSCEGYVPKLIVKDPPGWPPRAYPLPPGIEPQYSQHRGTGVVPSQFPWIAPRPHPEDEHYTKMQFSPPASQVPSVYPGPVLTSPIHDPTNLQQQIYTHTHTNSQSQSHVESLYGLIDAQWTTSGPAHTMPMAQSLIPSSPARGIHPFQNSAVSITPTNAIPTTYTYEPRMQESSISPSSYISYSKDVYQTMYVNGIHAPRSGIGKFSVMQGLASA